MAKPKKLSLKIFDLLILERELNSLLTEDQISFVTKYDITKLLESVTVVCERFYKSRTEVIEKHGVPMKDSPSRFTLDGADQKEQDIAVKIIEELGEKEEVFTAVFSMEDFKDLKSKYPYKIFYKFVDTASK